MVALGVTLFLLTVGMKSEAEAQCDPGWTHITDTLLVQGCLYEVDLCAQCYVSHPGKVKINNFRKLDDSCPDTLDPNETLQQLFSQVSTWAYLWFDQCQSNIPPCDLDSAKEVTFEYNVCWLMKKDTISNRMWYLPCTDEVCTVTYKICMNPDMSLNTTITNMTPPSIPFGCTLEGYQVVEPIYHNQESDCFVLHTPCNPDGGWNPY
ncbi:MAG: hypothetical protein H6615_08210 [Ignavibacteria bacterium]|nr:hypothetical protein [Ignavibacteria bacterium]